VFNSSLLFVMSVLNYQENEHTESCDVCRVPLQDIANTISKEHGEHMRTFCSEKCFALYLEDPELYNEYLDEDDEIE
jgi:hypothetical protein